MATDPKIMAKVLRGELRARLGVEVTHGECLEIVARQHGAADWNVLAARARQASPPVAAAPWGARALTIPVLRVFDSDTAVRFYVEFLGFELDFGGPNGGPGTSWFGQVSRATTTLHLAEAAYDARPGATVFVWLDGIEELRRRLDERRTQVPVWGPAVWTPDVEDAQWGGRVLTLPDPFGNHLRFSEPDDPDHRAGLPRWA